MPLFSAVVSRLSPRLLREIRIRAFLDIDRVARWLPKTGKAIDLGCGYGAVTSRLAEIRPDLELCGVDPDREAVERARTIWSAPNLEFRCGSIETLHEQADAVLLLHVLHHLPEGLEGPLFGGIRRVLKSEGRLIFEDPWAGHCRLGEFLDRTVSRSPALIRTESDILGLLKGFTLLETDHAVRAWIGNLWIVAERRSEAGEV